MCAIHHFLLAKVRPRWSTSSPSFSCCGKRHFRDLCANWNRKNSEVTRSHGNWRSSRDRARSVVRAAVTVQLNLQLHFVEIALLDASAIKTIAFFFEQTRLLGNKDIIGIWRSIFLPILIRNQFLKPIFLKNNRSLDAAKLVFCACTLWRALKIRFDANFIFQNTATEDWHSSVFDLMLNHA